MKHRGAWLALSALLLGILAWRSTFIVGQSQLAVRTRFGRIVGSNYAPGLHLKSPLDQVRRFDRRLNGEVFPGETFPTQDHKSLSIDLYLQWRVVDPVKYLLASGGERHTAASRLHDIVLARLKAEVASQPMSEVIADRSPLLGKRERERIGAAAASLGVALVDVQFEHIAVSDDVASAIYQRMQQSLMAQAQQMTALGNSQAESIRTAAQRQRAQLLADATVQSQQLRAKADTRSAAIYARAYGRAPAFAAFYQSLQAARKTLGQPGDVLVLSPDGQFFKYLHAPAH